jgi:hypothetical protein
MMFYKAIGFVVWRLAVKYVRQNYGRRLRVAGLLTVALVLAGAVASRSSSD